MIRENNIKAPIKNSIKDPIKDTLVPLRTNFNANGSVRWRTSVYLNLFHGQMGKNFGNHGVCRYVQGFSFDGNRSKGIDNNNVKKTHSVNGPLTLFANY